MKTHISYSELTDIVRTKTGAPLSFNESPEHPGWLQVNGNVNLNLPFVGEKTIGLSTRITVTGITGDNIHIRTSGGTSLLASMAMHFTKGQSIVETAGDNTFIVHLDKIDNLRPALEKTAIESIQIASDGIYVEIGVKA